VEREYSSKRSKATIILIVVALIVSLYALVPPPDEGSFMALITQYYYQLLTAGVMQGHVSLPVLTPQGFLNLSIPYDPLQSTYYQQMLDASFYKGKFYLYFGPLPLLYYIPYYLLTGKLASSHAAAIFFLSLGFSAGFYLLAKIKFKFFPQISMPQLILAGLVLGLCNNALFLLSRPSVYEVAIASAFCFMNLALLFLFDTFSNNFKLKDIALFSICLALCVAGRPNFALACFATVPLILLFFIKLIPKQNLLKASLALVGPMLIIAMALAMYNYVRFDSFLEFGMHYQIAVKNHFTDPEMKIDYHNLPTGLHYYFFSKFSSGQWAGLSQYHLKIMKFAIVKKIPPLFNYSYGYVRSVFTTSPVCLFIFALPLVFIKNKNSKYTPLLRFMSFTFLAVGIIIFYTTLLGVATQRYMTDFLAYMVLLAIITAWYLEENTLNTRIKKIIQVLFIVTELTSMGFAFSV
jgi:hypothetical protein